MYNDGNGEDSGHARVYEYSNESWTQIGSDIDGGSAYDRFGESVAISDDGSILAVSATGADVDSSNDVGHTRLYSLSESDQWTQMATDIDGELTGDQFGYNLSLSGDGTTLAGSSLRDNSDDGLVKTYLYTSATGFTDASGNYNSASNEFSFEYDGTFPTIDVSNMFLVIVDGMTDLGTAKADENVTWSISGDGVRIDSSGSISLHNPSNHNVKASHTYTVTATDTVGNRTHLTMTVKVGDVTAPDINYGNLNHRIDEGTTALGYVTSNEPVTWSIEGEGVSIDSSGIVTLDTPANYASSRYHSYRVIASDEAGIFRNGYMWTVHVNDNTPPIINLIGSANVEIEIGNTYIDAGATASDNGDGDITSSIVLIIT